MPLLLSRHTRPTAMNIIEPEQPGGATVVYMAGRRYVVGGILTTKKRRPRRWTRSEAIDLQRVFRAPLVTFLRCVERR